MTDEYAVQHLRGYGLPSPEDVQPLRSLGQTAEQFAATIRANHARIGGLRIAIESALPWPSASGSGWDSGDERQ
jgi:hypothetical protein